MSSAKLTSLEQWEMPLSMSIIIIKNSKGPRTVPWGTPLRTGLGWLIPPGILT